jgi:hypothetical protein
MRIASFAVASIVLAAPAFGQEAPSAAAPRVDDAFRLDFTADAWFPRLVGDVVAPGGATRDVELLELDDSEVAFAGRGRLSWDRCFVEAGGFAFDTDGSYSSGGNAFESSMDWWAVSATIGYHLFTPFADQSTPWGEASFDRYGDNVNSEGDYRVDLRLAPTLGVLYEDLEFAERNRTLGSESGLDGGFMAVMLGGEFQLWLRPGDDFGLLRAVVLEAAFAIGPSFGVSGDASGTNSVVTFEAGGRIMILDNVGVHLGYRLVDGDYEGNDADPSLEVGLQGLVAGVAIRF